ncbi:AAA family ATPase [Stetteria hydrogenophila]
MQVIIAVAGMPGSGKTVASSMIAEKLSCPIVSMGDAVRREVARRGLEVNAKNVEMVAQELRERYGRAAVARLVEGSVREALQRSPWVVVDGVRGLEEVAVFAGIAATCVVAVHASPATRHRRLLERGRPGETPEALMMRDRYNLRFGVGEVIALADFAIINEWGIPELERQVNELVGVLVDGAWKRCGRGRDKAY